MRIAQLQLIAYGPFRGLELDLSAGGMHMVFGRNEAGKSTTLRAITSLLYGIEPRTQDAHLHKPAELRVGGVLVGEDGARVRVVRRKGVSKGGPNTLLDERGQALDEAVVQRLLRGVSEETFRHAFGLDHDTLALGAKALLEGRGDIGGSLFDASVGGGADARRLLAELTEEADKLYKPRATTARLNDALKSFAEAQKSVKEKQSLPEAYVAQQKALEDAQLRRAALAARRAELAARRAQLERARRRVPLERRRAQLVATLGGLGDVARHAPRVTSLHARLAAYERALVAHRDDAAAATRLRDRVSDAARRAGAAAPASGLRIDVRTQSRIQKHVQERATLTERLETSRVETARNERELARLRADLHAPEVTDAVAAAALARAVEQARKLGDPTGQLATQTARAARRRADLEARAAALGLFEGTLEELVVLRPPSASALDALARRAAELDAALARQLERAVELASQADALAQRLAQASGDFAPPSAAELREARETRDRTWARLREARAGREDARALAALDSTFERALVDADVLADRMIREADRVTTLAALRAQQSTTAQQLTQAEADRATTLAERAKLEEEHRRLWSEAGIGGHGAEGRPGPGLAEMRAWLAKHGQIVDAFAAVRDGEADVEETARVMAAARASLASALAGAGVSAEGTLVELLDVASARVERIETAARTAAESARSITKLEALLDERKATSAGDERGLAEARARLADLLTPLGIPEDADVDEVTRALEALRELFSLEDQRADAESRAGVARVEAEAFEAEAARAADELGAELVGLPARDVVTELASRSDKARAAQQELAAVEAQLAELGEGPVAEDVAALVADGEAADRALEEVEAALGEAEHELSRVERDIGGIEKGLQEVRADSGAAEASAQAQEALSRVRVNVERYVRAKVAAVVLAREIERYREENQGPMLTMASRLFARLTLGKYTGVRAGYDDRDRPALRCVREGNVEVDVTGLSDGTRDQLYLSLRLASLERYAEMAEPMPLVLDDVLIQFDDERSHAALEIIAELSTRMQVLFFTHHARMVDLARAAVPSSSLTVHELTSPPVVSAPALVLA